MRFSTIFTALFNPYFAHEQTAHNLDFVSSLVALRSYSYWAPLLPKLRFAQERRAFERFQRTMHLAPVALDPINKQHLTALCLLVRYSTCTTIQALVETFFLQLIPNYQLSIHQFELSMWCAHLCCLVSIYGRYLSSSAGKHSLFSLGGTCIFLEYLSSALIICWARNHGDRSRLRISWGGITVHGAAALEKGSPLPPDGRCAEGAYWTELYVLSLISG